MKKYATKYHEELIRVQNMFFFYLRNFLKFFKPDLDMKLIPLDSFILKLSNLTIF